MKLIGMFVKSLLAENEVERDCGSSLAATISHFIHVHV
jgi:hypothetical protein